MTIKELIAELDKLEENAEITRPWVRNHAIIMRGDGTRFDEPNRDMDATFVSELVNAYPTLRKAALAGEALRQDVQEMTAWLLGEQGDFPNLSQKPHYSFRTELRARRDAALAAYDKAMEV